MDQAVLDEALGLLDDAVRHRPREKARLGPALAEIAMMAMEDESSDEEGAAPLPPIMGVDGVYVPNLGGSLVVGERALIAKEPGLATLFEITGVLQFGSLPTDDKLNWARARDSLFVRARWFSIVGDDDGRGARARHASLGIPECMLREKETYLPVSNIIDVALVVSRTHLISHE